ncbi:MAG: SUMF1/EgtB/PvdO family nonheme iron enzyme [Bacteroidales bacterium]|nr:SUMF1/EgtB/PvdO family nonheme iron enzyme [Bacteroidales bacterium]
MNRTKKDMIPDAFESLLLEAIVSDFETNVEIKKSVTMNANYVMSMPVEQGLEHKVNEKITQLIQSKSKSVSYYLRVLLIIGVVSVLIIFIINQISNKPVTIIGNNPNLNLVPPTILKDTSKEIITDTLKIDKTEKKEIIQSQTKHITIKDTAKIKDGDIESKDVDSPWQKNTITPKYGSWYYEDFDPEYAKELLKDQPEVSIYPGELILTSYATEFFRWNDFLHDPEKSDSSLQEYFNKNIFMLPVHCGFPFKKGFENCTYISLAKRHKEIPTDIQKKPSQISLPEGLRYYVNENLFNENKIELSTENINRLQPFYISNTEVSNIEYKEFLYYVLKYNGKEDINIDSTLSEDDMRYFTYTFHQPNIEIQAKFGSNTLNVFPKTDCWEADYTLTYQTLMNKYYFFHPAYNMYPVVGISYWQALAYLDWMTCMWQTRIDEQGILYHITFDLPHDYEWELAGDEVLRFAGIGISSDRIICDLDLVYKNDFNYTRSIGNRNNGDRIDFEQPTLVTSDRYIVSGNSTEIKNLNGNVSEWIKEDYINTWATYRQKNIELLETSKNPGDKILKLTEEYFDSTRNNHNGKMVRGLNWFDNRKIDKVYYTSNAIFAKCFINPDEQHSTLGFRYVVRVRLKDQEKAMRKIEILGRNMPSIDYSLLEVTHKPNYTPDPEGFKFIPPGSFKYKDSTTTVQGFWAMQTEVCNFTWLIFLNYLIENNMNEDLAICIPNDPLWKVKMNLETDTVLLNQEFDKTDLYKYLPFTKKFISDNNIKEIPVTFFAFEPVVGISHKAAKLFAVWFTKMTNPKSSDSEYYVEFRLPTEAEYEYMAAGGLQSVPYAWGGPYTRNYKGSFLAKFRTNIWEENKLLGDTSKTKQIDKLVFDEIVKNQNSEFTEHKSDSNWYNPNSPNLIASFTENEWGLLDVCGNAAEMIITPDKTKGGSWASGAYFIQIQNEENWDGTPSDCVGFRLVRTFLGRNAFNVKFKE